MRIEIEAREAVVEVGGLCLGFADEHPLQPEPARVVVADAPADYAGDGADLALQVDRGTVGYTTPLVRQPEVGDPFSAWGDVSAAEVAGVYARVSSTGSGTVRLTRWRAAGGAGTMVGPPRERASGCGRTAGDRAGPQLGPHYNR